MRPEITVVIPTYNRSARLPGLIAALEAQTLAPERFEVCIVDNGSTDDTSAVLAKLAADSSIDIRPLRIAHNNGPAAARNLGWQEAAAEILAYTDDDVFCDPTWLAAGLDAMQLDPSIGVMQGSTTPPDGKDIRNEPLWTVHHTILGNTPYFEACNIFFRRTALAEIGGFDEQIGWWGEDTATGWQILEAGWTQAFAAGAHVVHPLEHRGVRDFVRNGFLEKNMVLLAYRHPGFREAAFWRPWAFRKRDAALTVAVGSVLVGLVWRPALLGALPYLWWTRPPNPRALGLRGYAEVVAVDAARSAGHLAGSWKSRGFIL
jgi:GT2 family glycosyltransferase